MGRMKTKVLSEFNKTPIKIDKNDKKYMIHLGILYDSPQAEVLMGLFLSTEAKRNRSVMKMTDLALSP